MLLPPSPLFLFSSSFVYNLEVRYTALRAIHTLLLDHHRPPQLPSTPSALFAYSPRAAAFAHRISLANTFFLPFKNTKSGCRFCFGVDHVFSAEYIPHRTPRWSFSLAAPIQLTSVLFSLLWCLSLIPVIGVVQVVSLLDCLFKPSLAAANPIGQVIYLTNF